MKGKIVLNDKNKRFSNVVYGYKKYYDEMYKKSMNYKINLQTDSFDTNKILVEQNKKKQMVKFYPIGLIKDKKFHWSKNMNTMILEHLERYQLLENGYVDKKLIDYLFSTEFDILSEYPYLLIYLLAITNPKFNVLTLHTENNKLTLVAFIELGIEDNYDYQKEFVNKFN